MPFVTGEQARQASERRAAERRRVSLASWVVSLDGPLVIACQTWDASPRGVQVRPKEPQTLPRQVYYLDAKDRMAYEAQVRWQDKAAAGLEFTKAWRFADLKSPAMQKVIADIARY